MRFDWVYIKNGNIFRVEMNDNLTFFFPFFPFYSQKATRAMEQKEGIFSIVNEAWCVSLMCKCLNDLFIILITFFIAHKLLCMCPYTAKRTQCMELIGNNKVYIIILIYSSTQSQLIFTQATNIQFPRYKYPMMSLALIQVQDWVILPSILWLPQGFHLFVSSL